MRRFRTWVFAGLAGAALLAGCAAQNAVREAELSLDQARKAGAERAKPYEFYAAEGYLELAKDEHAQLDPAARMYAEKSMELSKQAMGR